MPPVSTPARTIVVTGGHTGLGLALSRHLLATSPDAHLVWAVRSPEAAHRAAVFAYELDRRLREAGSSVTVNAFDPGLMPGTGLARANPAPARWAWNHVLPALRVFPGVNSPDTSGRDLARLVVDPSVAGVSGAYFERERAVPSSALSRRPDLWTELWAGSEQLLAEHVPASADGPAHAPAAA